MALPASLPDHVLAGPSQGAWTLDDLAGFPEGDNNRYEIIAGVLHVTRQPHWQHQSICTELVGVLWFWNKQTAAGKVLVEPGMVFAENEAVVPDLVWVRQERLAQVLHADGKLHSAPDLVVEVLSPDAEGTLRDREIKRELYGRHRVQEYWIVDRWQRQVEIYRPTRPDSSGLALAQVCGDQDELTSPLLPGFGCAVAALFVEV